MPTQPPTTLSTGCMPPSSFLIEANTEPRWGYWGCCCCLPRSESLRAGASLPCPPFCGLCVMMTIVVVVMMMMIMSKPTKVCHSIKTLKTGKIDSIWCTTTLFFFSLSDYFNYFKFCCTVDFHIIISATVRRKESRYSRLKYATYFTFIAKSYILIAPLIRCYLWIQNIFQTYKTSRSIHM